MSHSYSLEQKITQSERFAVAGHALPARAKDHAPFRLLCAARYGQLGASSRLRLAQYRPWLAQAGIITSWRAFLSDDYVAALYNHRSRLLPAAASYWRAAGAIKAVRRHDMVWIEKELLPWLPYWLERRVIGATPYVLDFDDAWSLRYQHSGSALVRVLLGNKFAKLLRGAALTITANETLYNWAKSEGAGQVVLLPTVVDLDRYVVAPEPPGPFTICWIGTPLTACYLEAITRPLQALNAEAPVKLLIIGAPHVNIAGVPCEHAAWDEATEAALIGTAHVGIMPLPDDEWARGKSGYKLIQYMAMGRPAVASGVGANRAIVKHGSTGFLADTEQDWLAALRKLRDDAALRTRMGEAARRLVEQKFCLNVTAPLLIEAMRGIVQKA